MNIQASAEHGLRYVWVRVFELPFSIVSTGTADYRADTVGKHATNHGLLLDKMMQINGADAGADRGTGRGLEFHQSKYWNRMIDRPQMRPFLVPMCPKYNPLVNSFPSLS